MSKALLGALLFLGCADAPIRHVRLAPDVDLLRKAVLVCVWPADSKRELTCMTPADAELILGNTRPDPAPARCVTSCGLRADVDEGSCKSLQTTETRALQAFARNVPDFRPWQQACRALEGWRVKVIPRDPVLDKSCPRGSWRDPWQGCVLGMTRWAHHRVEVENEAWPFNALTHEIGHVLDHSFGTERGTKHCGWEDRGIRRSILEVTGEPDEDLSEDCP